MQREIGQVENHYIQHCFERCITVLEDNSRHAISEEDNHGVNKETIM